MSCQSCHVTACCLVHLDFELSRPPVCLSEQGELSIRNPFEPYMLCSNGASTHTRVFHLLNSTAGKEGARQEGRNDRKTKEDRHTTPREPFLACLLATLALTHHRCLFQPHSHTHSPANIPSLTCTLSTLSRVNHRAASLTQRRSLTHSLTHVRYHCFPTRATPASINNRAIGQPHFTLAIAQRTDKSLTKGSRRRQPSRSLIASECKSPPYETA